MPTEDAVRCSSITLTLQNAGSGPSGCQGVGLRRGRPHQARARAIEPKAAAGWPPSLASPVSFRRATQTYKASGSESSRDNTGDQGLVQTRSLALNITDGNAIQPDCNSPEANRSTLSGDTA